jgi:hypothetical protein
MKLRDFIAGLLLTAMAPGAQGQQPGKEHRLAVVSPSDSV